MSIRKRTVVVAGAAAFLMGIAGPASAHTHQVCTPGAGDPYIEPEPYHGGLPGNSESTRQDLGTNPNFGSRGFHPIHESLHLSQAEGKRRITVVVAPAACPST